MLPRNRSTALAVLGAGLYAAGAMAQVPEGPELAPAGTAPSTLVHPDAAAPAVRVVDPTAPASGLLLVRLPTLSGPGEDWMRVAELRTGAQLPLLRSPSILMPDMAGDSLPLVALALLIPELRSQWNSDLPFTFNDGGLWAGRGLNLQSTFGFQTTVGPVQLTVAPQVIYQQNEGYQVIPLSRGIDDARHPLSSPWYGRGETIDLPSRFGTGSYAALGPGQSSLRVRLGPAALGWATENLWWGPGIRNALVMSSNASGIPHLFLRTERPVRTAVGDIEAQWILGRLRESRYFDDVGANNFRALSGLAIALRPALEPDLSIGLTRVVYRVQTGRGFPFSAALDVLKSVGRPNARPADDLLREREADQIFSLFARWAFPAAGVEAYGEWGRYEEPASLRDLLTAPHHSQGYTLGLQWVSGPAEVNAVRVQGELTYLEPSTSYRERRVISWYTSRPVPQGYTQEGQPIGAAIGPGASSQWLAVDYLLGDRSRVGGFANRIRWDNAAFYETGPRPFFAHDVSMLVGLRGTHPIGGFDVGIELSTGSRLNYLFQNTNTDWGDGREVDVRNHTVQFSVSPRVER